MIDFLLVDNTITVRWASRTKRHYVSRGYRYTGMGKEFDVNVRDLPPGSKAHIAARCPYCKKDRLVQWQALIKAGNTACQKCASKEASFIDLTDETFGRLTVVGLARKRGKNGQYYYTCKCTCGEYRDVEAGSLVSGATKSCGCLQRDMASERMGAMTGAKNPMWDPTRTDEDRDSFHRGAGHQRWRKAVLEKAGHECVRCGAKDDLHAHHVFSYSEYPEKRRDVENGIVMCKNCHDAFHNAYGQTGVADIELAMFLAEPR